MGLLTWSLLGAALGLAAAVASAGRFPTGSGGTLLGGTLGALLGGLLVALAKGRIPGALDPASLVAAAVGAGALLAALWAVGDPDPRARRGRDGSRSG